MPKSYKINGELIKSSGEKLIMVGYLMIGSIGVLILYFFIISNSRDMDFIQFMGVFAAIISIIFTYFITKNIIKSGSGFIESVETTYEDGVFEEYYSNGNLKEKGTYMNGKKDGSYESYFYNGQLESRGTFIDGKPDGDWELYNRDGTIYHSSGYYENGVKVRPLK